MLHYYKTNDVFQLTKKGTPVGTPQYMAPEQAEGKSDIDFRADIFSLGATMYEICTKTKAFSGNTSFTIYKAQSEKNFIPIDHFRNDLPHSLINLIHKMLEPKLESRIATYNEIRETIENIQKSSNSI